MLSALLLLTWAQAAWAQSGEDYTVNVDIFQPNTDFYGYSQLQGAATLGNLQLGAALWLNSAADLLVLEDAAGNRISPNGAEQTLDKSDGVIDSRITTDLQLGFGFTRFVSLSVDLPVALSQRGTDLATVDVPGANEVPITSSGLSDVSVQLKGVALDRDRAPFGLAIAVPATLPTGSATGFLAERSFTVAPTLIGEFSDGSIRNRGYTFRSAVNLGYMFRTDPGRIRDVYLGNALLWGLGVGIRPADPLEVMVELHGESAGPRSSQNAGEALVGMKLLLGRWLALDLGGGVGVLPGIGSPDTRIYMGVQFAPSFDPNARDTDRDFIADGDDKCPKDAEDVDGFQDKDGCPELDNDADGREDGVDQCPNDPEDDDGYLDNDGCPEADNDKDNIPDSADRCPDESETINGYLDEDGCADDKPIDDSDGDGYKDDIDRCPYDGEDLDGFEDEDGCPDKDNDGDSIPDTGDKCPNERELFNGNADDDGCPDETARVVIRDSNIEINDVIYFDFGKATIQERSFDLVDEIAQVLNDHPELKKIRVEGHTDNVGNDTNNLRLSQARAEAVVQYLISKGVDASRLDPVGFGEMRPIADNTSEEGRSKNRRVEFIIVSREK